MSTRQYDACLHPVSSSEVDQGTPPTPFLDELIDAIAALPDEVFTANDLDDIYGLMEPVLGPWESLIHRRAAMCEVLRVLAGFESSWDWETGVYEGPGGGTNRPEDEWETGAFQVSANSMGEDASLSACVDRLAGADDTQTFLESMKSNHSLAVEYCARLLRFSTSWSGPIDEDWVSDSVWRPAVAEFQSFLSPSGTGFDTLDNSQRVH